MTILDKLAYRYQSRRVASDILAGRNIDTRDMWWLDKRLAVEREELERAKQAQQQSDQDALAPQR